MLSRLQEAVAGQGRQEVRKTVGPGRTWRLRLRVRRGDGDVHIALSGRAQADMMLESLHKFLVSPRGQTRLRLDLGAMEEMDDLAVSALIVALRCYGRAFQGIVLTGLPARAVNRLRFRGSAELLGSGWRDSYAGGQARYWRG